MTKCFRILLSLSATVLHGPGTFAEEGATASRPVLVQNVADNILWTRRADTCTLQIITQWRVIAPQQAAGASTSPVMGRRELPAIEVRLLRKDGGAISPIQRWQTPTPKPNILVPGHLRPEVLYAFPLSAGSEAVAVVVCTDGKCLTRKIAPFIE